MPTSTRRQAASRNQRYSEVSVGALSIELAEEDDQQNDHGEEADRDFDDEVTIDDAEAELNEAFGANGMPDVPTTQRRRYLLIYP